MSSSQRRAAWSSSPKYAKWGPYLNWKSNTNKQTVLKACRFWSDFWGKYTEMRQSKKIESYQEGPGSDWCSSSTIDWDKLRERERDREIERFVEFISSSSFPNRIWWFRVDWETRETVCFDADRERREIVSVWEWCWARLRSSERDGSSIVER